MPNYNNIITPNPADPTKNYIEFTNTWARHRYGGFSYTSGDIYVPDQNQIMTENYLFVVDTGNKCYSNDILDTEVSTFPWNTNTPNGICKQPTRNEVGVTGNLKILFATARIRPKNVGTAVVANFDIQQNLIQSSSNDLQTPYQRRFFLGNYWDSFLSYHHTGVSSPPQVTFTYPTKITNSNQYENFEFQPLRDTQAVLAGGQYPTYVRENYFTFQELFPFFNPNNSEFGKILYNKNSDKSKQRQFAKVYREMLGTIVVRFNPITSSNCLVEYDNVW